MKKIIILLTLVFFISFPFSVKAKEVLKVGWIEQPNYQETLSNGNKYGYSYEYYRIIAKYVNYEYEFVDISFDPSKPNFWQTYMDNGTIDVMGCISYSETLDEKYTFSTLPQGNEVNSLFTLSTDTSSELEDVAGKKIGVKYGHNSEALEKYLLSNSISATVKEYGGVIDIIDALKKGEIDFGSSYGANGINGIRSIDYYGNTSFYFCFKNSNTSVISNFNNAMKEIQSRNIHFNEELRSKYILEAKNEFVVTDEEKEYVKELNAKGNTIVYFSDDNYPFSYVENGQHKGIMVDVCDRVFELTGIKYEVTFERNMADAIGFIENNFIDADNEGYDLSQTIFSTNLVVVGDLDGKNIAIPKYITNYDRFDSYNYDFTKKENITECFEALKNKEVDGIICTRYSSDYFLNSNEYSFLPINELTGFELDISMAIKKEKDAVFTSLVTRALKHIADTDIQSIITDNTTMVSRNKFVLFIEQLDWYVILIIFSVLILIVTGLVYIMIYFSLRGKALQKILDNDKLTGLYSFDGYCRKYANAVKKLDSNNKYFITIAKICFFDVYLDINGQKMADRLIIVTGKELKSMIKENEFLARFQYDSFVMFNSGKDVDELKERIQDCIVGERYDVVLKYAIYEITNITEDPHSICEKTLQVITERKRNIQSTIEVYDRNIHSRKKDDMELIADFDNALDKKEFIVYYQAKFDTVTEKIVGAEALVRWKKNDEIISPGRFIQLFEENDMIEKLDFYVLGQVCDTINKISKSKNKVIPFAINFSRVHLYNPTFVETVIDIVKKKGVDPSLIEIELTETSFSIDLNVVNKVVERLHNAGFTVSIDDFGSGYSSLNMLKDVNADVIKIDMAFLSNFKEEAKSAIVVSSVIRMSKWLGMTTIAEGVEDIEQVEYLKSVGCDLIQGYYFAKPKPFDDLLEELSKGVSENTNNDYKFDVEEVSQILGGNFFVSKFLNSINISCGIYEYFEGRLELVRVNVAYEKTFMTNAKYDLGRINTLDFIHKDDRKNITQSIDLLIKTNVPRSVSFRRMISDNTFCYIRGTAFLITGEEKRHLICLTFTDVSKEEEFHEKLEKTKKDNDNLSYLISSLIKKHYEYIAIIDANTSEYVLYGDEKEVEDSFRTGLFNEGTRVSAKKFINEEMKEKYFENAKFETVIKHLLTNGSYSYRFEITKNNQVYDRKVEFYFTDNKEKIILLATLIKLDEDCVD